MSGDGVGKTKLEVIDSVAKEYVTVRLAGQLLGVPVLSVHDVLREQNITHIPRSPDSITGVLNLRGKIVTAIDLRVHLGFDARGEDEPYMCVVVEHRDEAYAFLVDEVCEVLSVSEQEYESNPVTLDDTIRDVSDGIFRLEGELLVILSVDKLLSFQLTEAA